MRTFIIIMREQWTNLGMWEKFLSLFSGVLFLPCCSTHCWRVLLVYLRKLVPMWFASHQFHFQPQCHGAVCPLSSTSFPLYLKSFSVTESVVIIPTPQLGRLRPKEIFIAVPTAPVIQQGFFEKPLCDPQSAWNYRYYIRTSQEKVSECVSWCLQKGGTLGNP